MEINVSSVIRHPLDRVFRAYRDELSRVAPYLGNVKEIRVEKREEADGVVKLHNVWVGKGEVPRFAQGILKPEALCWDDFADWYASDKHCNWRLKTRVFTDAVNAHGENRLSAEGGGTRVTLKGTLDINLKEIPGVPKILAGTLKPQIEGFIVALIKPNLEQTNAAIGRYLDANP